MKIVMKIILFALVLLINFGATAGNIFPAKLQAPSDPGGDPGSVPIDDFRYVLLLGGIVLGAYLVKMRKVSLKR
jgi:hypothetical protein